MSRDLLIVNMVIGILLPAVVQLMVKSKAPEWVKSVVNLAVSAVAGVLAPLATTQHVDWITVLLSIAQVFVLSIASHYGLLKPIGATGSEGMLAKVIPGGFGRKGDEPHADVSDAA